MESQTQAESQHVSKMELDQNMNSTVSIDDDVIEKSNEVSDLCVDESVLKHDAAFSENKRENTHSAIEQLLKADDVDEQTNYLSDIRVKFFHKSENADGFQKSSASEQESKAEESRDLNGGNEIPKHTESLPKLTSILASELMADTKPSEKKDSSPTGSFLSSKLSPGDANDSPEAVCSNKYSASAKRKGKQRRRGSAWTDDETDFLMEVWAKQSELMKQKGGDESVTCAPVYRLISRSMAELGFDKSWEQCKTRIHTLKRAYKITKDEIDAGARTITYCRHFDKLEIISGDNPQITAGMLSAALEKERKQRDVKATGKKQPVKRKLVVGENPNIVGRNSCSSVISTTGVIPKLLAQTPQMSISGNSQPATNSTCSNTTWYPPQATEHLQPSQMQPQQSFASGSNIQLSQQNNIQPFQAPLVQASPAYSYQPTNNGFSPPPPYSGPGVGGNQNFVNIKSEGSDNVLLNQYSMVSSSTPWNSTQSSNTQQGQNAAVSMSSGNDLEKMRLNLELRKLEVERNKIEMEERQRREDRDHQYRMMQLLLTGLGQQNPSHAQYGQGSDIVHNHYSTDLLRALENGLVPGGSQKVNEKGLSFSEL